MPLSFAAYIRSSQIASQAVALLEQFPGFRKRAACCTVENRTSRSGPAAGFGVSQGGGGVRESDTGLRVGHPTYAHSHPSVDSVGGAGRADGGPSVGGGPHTALLDVPPRAEQLVQTPPQSVEGSNRSPPSGHTESTVSSTDNEPLLKGGLRQRLRFGSL